MERDKLGLATKVLVPGIWEKVCDAKERVHKPAEECLIILGRMVYRQDASTLSASSASSSSSHTSLSAAQDNFLANLLNHLSSNRSSRSKIGAMRVLKDVRSEEGDGKDGNGKGLGLKGVLPSLVTLLEDGDGSVREGAREVCRFIFDLRARSSPRHSLSISACN